MNTSVTSRRRWASVAEVAEHLGVSDRNVRQLLADGAIPAHRVGSRTIRVDLDELDASLRPYDIEEKPAVNEQEVAALTVLRAVEHRLRGDGEAMTQTLRGTGRQVSVRLCEAVEIIHHMLKLSDRPEQALAALLVQVSPGTTTD